MLQNLTKKQLYAFPLISDVLQKVRVNQTEKMVLVIPTWQTQPWYLQLLEMLKANPLIHTKPKKSWKSFRERTSISDEQDHEVGSVENIKKNLALSAISKTTSHLITEASRESTTSSYESAWRKRVEWCSRTVYYVALDKGLLLPWYTLGIVILAKVRVNGPTPEDLVSRAL